MRQDRNRRDKWKTLEGNNWKKKGFLFKRGFESDSLRHLLTLNGVASDIAQ